MHSSSDPVVRDGARAPVRARAAPRVALGPPASTCGCWVRRRGALSGWGERVVHPFAFGPMPTHRTIKMHLKVRVYKKTSNAESHQNALDAVSIAV